jgi:hypothetical protein
LAHGRPPLTLSSCSLRSPARLLRTNESFYKTLPTLAGFTERIRAKLRTRNRGEFAPLIRHGLCFLAVFSLLPPLGSTVLVLVGKDSDAYRLSILHSNSVVLTILFGGFYLLSTPSSKKQKPKVVFFISIIGGANVLSAYSIGSLAMTTDSWFFSDFCIHVVLLIALSVGSYKMARKGRA